MRIGIIGAGNIGGTIGRAWAMQGHDILFGVRDPATAQMESLLDSIAGNARAVSIEDAGRFGEAVLLAVPGAAVGDLMPRVREHLPGKIVLDATNNVRGPVMNSLATIHENVPTARLYRVFNSIGWENFAHPTIHGEQIDHFYCGPGGRDQVIVDDLVADVGVRPVYVGGLDKAELLDNLTRLWFTLAYDRELGRRLALKMLRD